MKVQLIKLWCSLTYWGYLLTNLYGSHRDLRERGAGLSGLTIELVRKSVSLPPPQY